MLQTHFSWLFGPWCRLNANVSLAIPFSQVTCSSLCFGFLPFFFMIVSPFFGFLYVLCFDRSLSLLPQVNHFWSPELHRPSILLSRVEAAATATCLDTSRQSAPSRRSLRTAPQRPMMRICFTRSRCFQKQQNESHGQWPRPNTCEHPASTCGTTLPTKRSPKAAPRTSRFCTSRYPQPATLRAPEARS